MGRRGAETHWTEGVGIPIGMLVAECSWAALALGAILVFSHVRVAFLELALPAAVVVVVLGFGARVAPQLPRWAMRTAAGAAVIVVAVVSAGTIGTQIADGSFTEVAFAPWHLADAPLGPAVTWAIALGACARGTWLSATRVTSRHVLVSAALGVIVYVGILLASAFGGASTLGPIASSALWWLVGFLVASAAVLVLIRLAELDRGGGRRPSTIRPDNTQRTFALSLGAGVVLAALGAAAVVALAAAYVGTALWIVVRPIVDFVVWLWHRLPDEHRRVRHLGGAGGAHAHAHLAMRGYSPVDFLVIAVAVIVVALVIIVVHVRLRRSREIACLDDDGDTSIDTLFTWRRLLAHLLRRLRQLLHRRRRPSGSASTGGRDPSADSVRAQYRRLLAAAAQHGVARGAPETTGEFEDRLAARFAPLGQPSRRLSAVTRAYEHVRYGHGQGHDDAELVDAVNGDVDWLIAELDDDDRRRVGAQPSIGGPTRDVS